MVKHPFKVHVWAILKRKIEKKIKKMVAQKKKISIKIFFNIIQEEWDDLDNAVIVNCINSMPNQVKACIDAEGAHTKY